MAATAPAYRRDPEPQTMTPTRDEAVRMTHEEPTPDEIAAEAYAIYMAHGQQDGRDMDHWLEAERALRQRHARG